MCVFSLRARLHLLPTRSLCTLLVLVVASLFTALITHDSLVGRPLRRSEESYLAIWLLRTRNIQRVRFSGPSAEEARIKVRSWWKHEGPKAKATDDVEVLASYVRNTHCWELSEWIAEARVRRKSISYTEPERGGFGCFEVDVNLLARAGLLPVEPNLAEIFKWLRSYSARRAQAGVVVR